VLFIATSAGRYTTPKRRDSARRDMIQVTLETTRLIADQSNDFGLRLTNIGRGPCTNIVFKLGLPVQMVLLQGSDRIEVQRLEAGQSVTTIVRVRPKQAGNWTLTSTNFSYRDAFGQSQRVNDLSFNLVAEAARAAQPPLDLMHNKVNVRDSMPQNGAEMDPGQAKIRRDIVEVIKWRFDREEFRSLCFDIGVKYDFLPSGGLEFQAVELVERCTRHGNLEELIAEIRRLRPGSIP
jgi:hypothetical protein